MILQPGDHVCGFYSSGRELVETVADFLAAGLRRGERCWYLPATDRYTTSLRAALKHRGIRLRRESTRGALVLVPANAAYAVRGDFEPERTLAIFSDAIEGALKDGFKGLRAAADMSWALRLRGGAQRLIAYEALLKSLFSSSRATGLCLFHRRRTPRRVVDGILATHPIAHVSGTFRQNPFYDPAVTVMPRRSSDTAKKLRQLKATAGPIRNQLRKPSTHAES